MHSAVESSIGLASRFTSAARMLALVTPPDVSRSFTTPPTWGARPAPSHLFHERVARDPTPCQTLGRATREARSGRMSQMTTTPDAEPAPQEERSRGSRKVVAGYFLSLDGVAEAPDRFLTAWDDETDASGVDLIATQDAVILGRRTFDEWAEFWPGSDIQPFASFINAVPKYVATSTPPDREWGNSHVIDGGLVEFVRHLKGGSGGDIGIHGSISVTQTLLAADLVDELRLVITPTI